MKLLIITNALEKGGAEKLITITAPLFKKEGVEVTLLLLDNKKSETSYLQTIEQAGISIINIKAKSYYSINNILKIRNVISKGNYDVLHIHLFPALYWASLAYRLRKRALSKTALIYTEHSTENKRRKIPFFKLIEKIIYKPFHTIVCITDEVQKKIKSWIGNNIETTIIKNGVSLVSFYQASIIPRHEFLPLLATDNINSKLLLMTASFRYPKNQKLIVEALQFLDKNFHLLLAGEGALLADLKEFSQSINMTDRIHFLGFRTDIPSLMKSVDINILSSDYEGMSGVTLEALASGKPFLGSDVPGINDVVPDDRFLFEKGNAKDLASKIENIINNNELANQMSADGLAYVKQYDVNIMVEKHIQLYQQLINK